VYVILLAAWS